MLSGPVQLGSKKGQGWASSAFLPGDVGMTAPGKDLRLRWNLLSPEAMETIHIDIPPVAFQDFADEENISNAPQLDQLDVLARPDPFLTMIAASMVRARRNGLGELFAQSTRHMIIAHLLDIGQADQETYRMTSHRVRSVTNYMRERLSEPLSLDDLARQASMSRFHFLRVFRESTGKTPHQFLTELRINAARQALERGDDTIALVGRRCGFTNPSHFSAAFRRFCGCSPAQYRKMIRSG
ncbi:helix-turn-helix domain-containing protein [Streptomyces sp. WAC 01325]|uniref:helix-turn-helix domain-containing protein n=1 Tax=Streptomyces sp. WAC 01325 TaxID=2203202 RepID=UPI00163CF11A|nr:AraC family transcriptional regulator [Streptomyces sp. WAC 01325]